MKRQITTLILGVLMSGFAQAQNCNKSILLIETDDSLYPGQGEVKLCTNSSNQLTKLIVIKPVQDPKNPHKDSDQPDERNPIMHITLEQINQAAQDIAILTPSRMGIKVDAALLEKPKKEIHKDLGGEIVLKVLKNKLLGSYHRFTLKLTHEDGEWNAYLMEKSIKKPLSRSFFSGGMAGIKKVQFY